MNSINYHEMEYSLSSKFCGKNAKYIWKPILLKQRGIRWELFPYFWKVIFTCLKTQWKLPLESPSPPVTTQFDQTTCWSLFTHQVVSQHFIFFKPKDNVHFWLHVTY
jgi:hypothetical protein